MPAPELVLTFDLALSAPPARVFAAVTEARHLTAWFCDRAEVEPVSGGRLVLEWNRPGATPEPFEGRWVRFEPPHACAYEGGHAGYPARSATDPTGYAGRVEFQVAAHGAGANLRVRHAMHDSTEYAPIAARYREVWPRALARLEHYLSPSR